MARAEALVGRPLVRHASMAAMFADADVDAVVLVLPIPMMAGAVADALRAGKHVISEKPLAPSFDAGLRLLTLHRTGSESGEASVASAATTARLAWTVSENWAQKPAVAWLRARLDECAIGRVLTAECSVLDGEAPRPAAGGGGGQGSGQGGGSGRGVSGGWRSGAEYEGGIFADVGVNLNN